MERLSEKSKSICQTSRADTVGAIWMDSSLVEGAFQMNTAWDFNVPELDPVFEEHTHDYDEVIRFYRSNPDDPL